jgi:hypothetical protein
MHTALPSLAALHGAVFRTGTFLLLLPTLHRAFVRCAELQLSDFSVHFLINPHTEYYDIPSVSFILLPSRT